MTTTAFDLTGDAWTSLGTGAMVVQSQDARNVLIYSGTTPDSNSAGISLAGAGGTVDLSWVTGEVFARAVGNTARVVALTN